jgi:hypothetical protein
MAACSGDGIEASMPRLSPRRRKFFEASESVSAVLLQWLWFGQGDLRQWFATPLIGGGAVIKIWNGPHPFATLVGEFRSQLNERSPVRPSFHLRLRRLPMREMKSL